MTFCKACLEGPSEWPCFKKRKFKRVLPVDVSFRARMYGFAQFLMQMVTNVISLQILLR